MVTRRVDNMGQPSHVAWTVNLIGNGVGHVEEIMMWIII